MRGYIILALLLGISIYSSVVLHSIFKDAEIPNLPEFYWGPTSTQGEKEDTSIRPIIITVPEKIVSDLKNRLKLELSKDGNRLVPPLEGIAFEYGFNTNFLKTVGQHWLEKYDWSVRQKLWNKYPQFQTKISGIDIHFQHIKSSNNTNYKYTRPLLLLHGWPGSFLGFQKVIPLLTDPKDSYINFELIIPSLPGFGFSEVAHRPGFGAVEAAQLFLKLMQRLGFNKFYAEGEDWGSLIISHMATLYSKHLMGIHLAPCWSFHPRSILRNMAASVYPALFVDKMEAKSLLLSSNVIPFLLQETGYLHIQSTKPATIGVALSNSPLGVAAYILEKFSTWTNPSGQTKKDGGLVPYFNMDELLDNVMVYWVTNCITSSMHMYAESFNKKQLQYELDKVPISVPTGCLATPNEILLIPRVLLGDKFHNIVQFTQSARGGHFAAFEIPNIVAKDVVSFVNRVESSGLVTFDENGTGSIFTLVQKLV